ncbi:MAG: hypothetical protein QQN55_08220, partial [Nitrosopumilus sp.]
MTQPLTKSWVDKVNYIFYAVNKERPDIKPQPKTEKEGVETGSVIIGGAFLLLLAVLFIAILVIGR